MTNDDRTPSPATRADASAGGTDSKANASAAIPAIPDGPDDPHRDQAGRAGSGDAAELQGRSASRSDRASGSGS